MRVDRARRLDEDEHLGVGEERPREHEPLALAARERPPALVDVGVEAAELVEHVLGVRDRHRRQQRRVVAVRAAPRVELRPQRAREEHRIGLADDDAPPNGLDRKVRQPHVAEDDPVVVTSETAEPVGDLGRLLRPDRDETREEAGLDDQARLRVAKRNAGGRLAAGASGSAACGATVSTASIRRLPTNARVIFSTASAAVRRGMTRNAA